MSSRKLIESASMALTCSDLTIPICVEFQDEFVNNLCLVCVDALHPSKQFFSHIEMFSCLSGSL